MDRDSRLLRNSTDCACDPAAAWFAKGALVDGAALEVAEGTALVLPAAAVVCPLGTPAAVFPVAAALPVAGVTSAGTGRDGPNMD